MMTSLVIEKMHGVLLRIWLSDSVFYFESDCTTLAYFALCCFTWSEGISIFLALVQLKPPMKLQ